MYRYIGAYLAVAVDDWLTDCFFFSQSGASSKWRKQNTISQLCTLVWVGFTGFYLVSMGLVSFFLSRLEGFLPVFYWFHRLLLWFTGFYCVVKRFYHAWFRLTAFLRVFTGFLPDFPGSNRFFSMFFQILPRLTAFYCVLPGFTGIDYVLTRYLRRLERGRNPS